MSGIDYSRIKELGYDYFGRPIQDTAASIAVGGANAADAVLVGLPDYIGQVAGINPTGEGWRTTLRNDNGIVGLDLKRGSELLRNKVYSNKTKQTRQNLSNGTGSTINYILADPIGAATYIGEEVPSIYLGGAAGKLGKVKSGVNLAKTRQAPRVLGEMLISAGQSKSQNAGNGAALGQGIDATNEANATGLAMLLANRFLPSKVSQKAVPVLLNGAGVAGQNFINYVTPK